MSQTPVNFTAKNAKDACEKLNELVDRGIFGFEHIGIMTEYVKTVTKNSDGTTSEKREPVWRFMGLAESANEQEMSDLIQWKAKRDELKPQLEESERRFKLLNGKAFGPLSVFLLIAGLICGVLGVLALAKVLPIPPEQIGISIGLTIGGVVCIGGAVLAAVLRGKKIKGMQGDRASIEETYSKLKEKEMELKGEEPTWHAEAIFQYKDKMVYNAHRTFELIEREGPHGPGPGPRRF